MKQQIFPDKAKVWSPTVVHGVRPPTCEPGAEHKYGVSFSQINIIPEHNPYSHSSHFLSNHICCYKLGLVVNKPNF